MPKVLPAKPVRFIIKIKSCNEDLSAPRVARYSKTAGRHPIRVSHGFNPGQVMWTEFEYPTRADRDDALIQFQNRHVKGLDGITRVEGADSTEPVRTKRPRLGVVLRADDMLDAMFGGLGMY